MVCGTRTSRVDAKSVPHVSQFQKVATNTSMIKLIRTNHVESMQSIDNVKP